MADREKWEEIPGYPGYLISNYGNVYSQKRDRVLKGGDNVWGYPQVSLSINNNVDRKTVHRLVAEAFIPNPDNKPEVNHIDGNKHNNSYTNLEWVTRQENMQHAFNNGFGTHAGGTPKIKVRVIETGQEFDSIRDCCRELGFNEGHVAAILRGEPKYKSHHGYHFERVD